MKSIGIDIGASNTVAAVWNGAEAVVVKDDQGNREISSLVSFEGSERYIGNAAKTRLTSNPENTLFGFSRLLGRAESLENVTAIMPFVVKEAEQGYKMQVTYGGVEENFTPEEITAMLISHVRMNASTRRYKVNSAAIAVPDTFTDRQLRAIETVCRITKMKVLGLINQTTAAAIAYGYETVEGDRTIMVINLGGSHLGISVVRFHDNKFRVLSDSQGIEDLGGQDFTESMVDDFIVQFKNKTGTHFVKEKEKANVAALRMKCEKAKIDLSHMEENQMDEPKSIFLSNFADGKNLDVEITRREFEKLNSKKFKKLLDYIRKVKAESQEIQEVVLVGGSTWMPIIRNKIEKIFKPDKIPINTDLNAVRAVAQGTAIFAASLTGSLHKNSVPENRASFTIGDEQIARVLTPLKRKKRTLKVLRKNLKRIDALDNKWKQNTDRLCDLQENALSVERLINSSNKADEKKCREILTWIEERMEKCLQHKTTRKMIKKKKNSVNKLKSKYQRHRVGKVGPDRKTPQADTET